MHYSRPTALVNGETCTHISLLDRGLAYGDGVFETIKIVDDRAILWREHKRRLLRGCSTLCIQFDDEEILDEEVDQLLSGHSGAGVLKIILTRGQGGRGYRATEGEKPSRLLWLAPYPTYPDCYLKQGVCVRVCKQGLAHSGKLAGLKHLNRLEQVMARLEWEDEYQEGLMLDSDDYVIEGTMSNLFIMEENLLITPSLQNCGVAGVMREYILNNAAALGFEKEEVGIPLSRILKADGAFICNALIGAWPIKQIEEKQMQISENFAKISTLTVAV